MSILSAQDLSLAHGAFDVFTGLSLAVPNDARIGLVGPNGIGKTSLLRIIAGVSPPTVGSVHLARGRRIGYLRQEAQEVFAGRGHSVYDDMLDVFAGLRAQAADLAAMEARMAAGDHSDELLAQYGAAQHAFEEAGGYTYEVRIKRVLDGLGFGEAQWGMSIATLSGGQKTRVLLARLLLEAPDLLILDEPTNHLDVQAIEWLENTLRVWPGALLIVSHDRYFLDRVVDHVWEMGRTTLDVYRGNYSAYVQQRLERWERNQQLFETEKARLDEELALIRRYIGWRRFDEARGKLKRLSRDLYAIERFGFFGALGKTSIELGPGTAHLLSVDEAHQRLKEIKTPVVRPPVLTMHLKAARRSGDLVLRTRDLRVGYPSKSLFQADDIMLQRGDCAALIGPNGAGKTTFLRTVLGELDPLAGEVRLGAGLKVGYFAQAHDGLHAENTVLDELMLHKKGITVAEARDYLAQYLFRGEDVFKQVEMLSGGERGRLALAILALDGANFLLLDEPTNHLDIPAQEVLQEGLDRFGGTLLLVSHDRYLVDRLATRIWDLRDGRLHVFDGTYQEYLAAREQEAARASAAQSAETGRRGRSTAGSPSSNGVKGGRTQDLVRLEQEIAQVESFLAECERQLQEESIAQRHEEVGRIGAEYAATQAQLDALLEEWAAMAAQET